MIKYFILLALFFVQCALAESIKIGVNTFLTGSATFWGDMSVKGLELALSEENSAGGVQGKQIELLYSDFGDLNYVAAVSAAHKFIDIDRVAAIFANVAEDAQVIYPIAARAGIPVIAIAVGSETATFGKPGLFRTSSSDLVLWKKSVDFLKGRNITRGCWAVKQSEYFLDMTRNLEPYWLKQIGQKPYIEALNPDQMGLSSLVLKFKEKQCQSVLLMSWIDSASEIIKRSSSIGYKPQFIGPTNVCGDKDFLNLVQNKAEGLVFGKFSTGTPQFIANFTKKFGRPPERPAATSYDALKLIAAVMRRYGTTSDAIKKGLSEIKSFSGASGDFSFAPDGTRSDESYQLLTIKDGAAVRLY